MTTERRLEDAVSNLEEMSVTIEEIKDQGCRSEAADKLDAIREEMTRTADFIEEALENGHPLPDAHRQRRLQAMTGVLPLRSKRDRRSVTRPRNGLLKLRPSCGGLCELNERRRTEVGFAEPLWACLSERCGKLERVRGVRSAVAVLSQPSQVVIRRREIACPFFTTRHLSAGVTLSSREG